jgi:hypothetical protein
VNTPVILPKTSAAWSAVNSGMKNKRQYKTAANIVSGDVKLLTFCEDTLYKWKNI